MSSVLTALIASTATSTTPERPSEDDLLFQDIPSVYAASKYEQKAAEAPASVSIITSDEIERYGYRTLGEVLQSVRSFYISNDRNYSYMGVRGFQRPGDYSTRVLLLIDGHRTNDALYDAALVGGEAFVELRDVDRIEIVRGPSSSLYGTSAFFAVINVITKRGRDLMGVEGAISAASFNTLGGRMAVGQRMSNGLEYFISGSVYDSRGQNIYFKEFDAPETNNGVAVGLDGETYYHLLPKVTWNQWTLQGGFSWREKGIPTASYAQVFNDPRAKTLDRFWYAELRYKETFVEILDVDARFFIDDYLYTGEYVYDYSESGDGSMPLINDDLGDGRWWGAELTGAVRIFEDYKITAGVELRHNLKQRQAFSDPLAVYFDETHSSFVAGAYVQADLRLLPSLILSGGLRYDHYSIFGGTFNPRAALIYQPFESTVVKALFGQAFRAPNAYELYYYDQATTKAPIQLDPEQIRTYELVLEQTFGPHLRASASGYFYRVRRLIALGEDPDDGLLVFQNLAENQAAGVEVELETKWLDLLDARVSYAFQRTWDPATGERLSSSPTHLLKLNVGMPIFGEALLAALEIQYAGGITTVAGTESPGFAVVNATLLSRDLIDNLRVSTSIYNLFNAAYGFPGSVEHAQTVILQDGRSWRLNVTVAF